MMRIISIGVLLTYLVSFTEFREILRAPILLQHFAEHQDQVAEMSFLEFLVMHYKTDIAHDETDMSLPFKDCGHSVSPIVVIPVQKLALGEQAEMNSKDFQSFYLQHEPKVPAADIFQPPKL